MVFLLILLTQLCFAIPTETLMGKARILSKIQQKEMAVNGVWIQGIRFIHLKTGANPDAMAIPKDYMSFHRLPSDQKKMFQDQYPSLKHLLTLIDPVQFQQEQELRLTIRASLRKQIKTQKVNLRELLLSLHTSSQPLDSAMIDELLGLEYEKTEADIKGDYASEAWIGHPKELSQTDYELIRKIFQKAPPSTDGVVYDLGSGYGRFLLYGGVVFPKHKFKGVELVSERVQMSMKLAGKLGLENVTFLSQDVLQSDLNDGSYFYIFNSFPSIEGEVLRKLAVVARKRKITIVCLGNIYKTLLQTKWLEQKILIDQWQQLAVFESKNN